MSIDLAAFYYLRFKAAEVQANMHPCVVKIPARFSIVRKSPFRICHQFRLLFFSPFHAVTHRKRDKQKNELGKSECCMKNILRDLEGSVTAAALLLQGHSAFVESTADVIIHNVAKKHISTSQLHFD